MKRALPLIGLIALMVYAGPKVGEPAPDFSLPDSLGVYHSLSDFKGKVVLLNFWQSSCPHCRTELPRLEEIYKTFKPKGGEVISVNIGDGWDVIKELTRDYSYLVLKDNGSAWNKYVQGGFIPLNYVIDNDAEQTVFYWGEGFGGFTEYTLRNKMNSALPDPVNIDVAVVSIDEPVGNICVGASYKPKITVKNLSTTPVNFYAGVNILLDDSPVFVDEKKVNNLGSDSSQKVSFSKWSVSQEGNYNILAYVYNMSDTSHKNDSIEGEFKALGIAKGELSGSGCLFEARPTLLKEAIEVRYEIPSLSHISIKVYDATGNLVKILMDRTGQHYGSVVWRGRDGRGKIVPQGIYFISLKTPEYRTIKKVVVLRR